MLLGIKMSLTKKKTEESLKLDLKTVLLEWLNEVLITKADVLCPKGLLLMTKIALKAEAVLQAA